MSYGAFSIIRYLSSFPFRSFPRPPTILLDSLIPDYNGAYMQDDIRRLKLELERAELALSGADLALWDWNIRTGEVLYDERWAAMLGEEARRLRPVFDEWRDRVHPEDLAGALVAIQEHVEKRTPYHIEIRMRHRDGSWRWILARGAVCERDSAGAPLRMAGTHMDITAQKEAELALADTAEMLAQIVGALEEAQEIGQFGNWAYAPQMGRVFWSRQLFRMLSREAGSGSPLAEEVLLYLEPRDSVRLKRLVALALGKGRPFSLHVRTTHPVTRHLHIEARPKVALGRVEELLGTAADITESIEREEQLKIAQERAEESNRVKSQFLANMSHEIRTPMNGVIGMTDLLLDTELSSEQREFALTVKESAESLLTVVNDILDFSKIEAGKMTLMSTVFSVRESLSTLERLFQKKIEDKRIHFLCEVEPEVPVLLKGDPVRFGQVLLNLVGNAMKFTPENGTVEVRISLIPGDEGSSLLAVTVRDSGMGIPAALREQIFHAFVQVDASTTRHFGGTGLGLSISSQLVRLMGGDISVESTPGIGSTFLFTVKFEAVADSHAAIVGGQNGVFSSQSKVLQGSERTPLHILLAEDNPINQMLAKRILEKAGHRVFVAENGRVAVEECARETFDLILMDIEMPELSGSEATRLIRANMKDSKTPIVALSAHSSSKQEEVCRSVGMDDFLPKPLNRQQLLSKIDQLTRSHE